jgi:hypothetical protein
MKGRMKKNKKTEKSLSHASVRTGTRIRGERVEGVRREELKFKSERISLGGFAGKVPTERRGKSEVVLEGESVWGICCKGLPLLLVERSARNCFD